MPDARKRPCCVCRCWFRPEVRVGDRQRACGKAECQVSRRKQTQANWRKINPEYARGYRIEQRAAQPQPPEPFRVPDPLSKLPWDIAKDQFGVKGTDFISLMGTLLIRTAKDQFRTYMADSTRVSGALAPLSAKDQFAGPGILTASEQGDATGVSPTRPAV
jgi:hypothetical protein